MSMMGRRDWWIGIALVVAVVALHALLPRYEWRGPYGRTMMRIDRWTGTAQAGRIAIDGDARGAWVPVQPATFAEDLAALERAQGER